MNILLTSVGRRSYMVNYFKEALADQGEIHAANSVETYSLGLADKYVITPLIYDNNYIDFLLDYCIKHKITSVIPLFDIDLPILARNKKIFSDLNIQLIVSDFQIIEICNDKWLTYNYLTSNGFKSPLTFLSINDALKAINRTEINYPLIIKPRWGMGSIGIYEADNEEELLILYRKTLNSIKNSYLKYESYQDMDKSVIVQEKLSGDEYGLDIFNSLKGEFLTCVPKIKLAMRAGETDSSEIINDRNLHSIGEKLGSITMHIGNLDVDCYFHRNEFYILEMNCRFGGQYPFSHLAGVNFPKAIVEMLKNNDINATLLTPSYGTKGFKDIIPVVMK
jgi:carbamoyl-phosphate synthase large subunit